MFIVNQYCISFPNELVCVTHGFMSRTHTSHPLANNPNLKKLQVQNEPIKAKRT